MIWLAAIPFAIGVGIWLYDNITEEEKQSQKRWENQRGKVERTLNEHRENISRHIREAQSSYDFHFLVDMHYSSVKVADAAYRLLSDAKGSLNGVGKMLNNTKKRKLELEAELRFAKQYKDKKAISRIIGELKNVNELRRGLFDEKDRLQSQKNTFYEKVKDLNLQTSELKQYIRYRCGSRGMEWYRRLESRKSSKHGK